MKNIIKMLLIISCIISLSNATTNEESHKVSIDDIRYTLSEISDTLDININNVSSFANANTWYFEWGSRGVITNYQNLIISMNSFVDSYNTAVYDINYKISNTRNLLKNLLSLKEELEDFIGKTEGYYNSLLSIITGTQALKNQYTQPILSAITSLNIVDIDSKIILVEAGISVKPDRDEYVELIGPDDVGKWFEYNSICFQVDKFNGSQKLFFPHKSTQDIVGFLSTNVKLRDILEFSNCVMYGYQNHRCTNCAGPKATDFSNLIWTKHQLTDVGVGKGYPLFGVNMLSEEYNRIGETGITSYFHEDLTVINQNHVNLAGSLNCPKIKKKIIFNSVNGVDGVTDYTAVYTCPQYMGRIEFHQDEISKLIAKKIVDLGILSEYNTDIRNLENSIASTQVLLNTKITEINNLMIHKRNKEEEIAQCVQNNCESLPTLETDLSNINTHITTTTNQKNGYQNMINNYRTEIQNIQNNSEPITGYIEENRQLIINEFRLLSEDIIAINNMPVSWDCDKNNGGNYTFSDYCTTEHESHGYCIR